MGPSKFYTRFVKTVCKFRRCAILVAPFATGELGIFDGYTLLAAFGEVGSYLAKESHMPTRTDSLSDHLSRYREINITVTGRKSGRSISNPIWFVFDSGKLYLLPVKGSETQWYKNALKNPSIHFDARGAKGEFNAVPITEAKQVSSVVEKFRAKYGAGDVKKYYSNFDVAVLAEPR